MKASEIWKWADEYCEQLREEIRSLRREVGRLELELEAEKRMRIAVEDVIRMTMGVRPQG